MVPGSLTSDINESQKCFVFLLCREISRLSAIFGRFGVMASLVLIGSADVHLSMNACMQRLSGERMVRSQSFASTLGLSKKHRLWKFKAGRVVSRGFRHAEFNGAQKINFERF